MTDVVGALLGCEAFEELAYAVPDGGDGTFVSLSEQRLQLGEDHLDRVEVRAVGRQEQQMGTYGAYRAPYALAFMASKVVEHDDIARPQRRDQELLDPGLKQHAVDGSIQDQRSDDATAAQASNEGHRLPMAMRHLRHQALATGRASVLAGHVRLGPGFVDEDQPVGVDVTLMALPAIALAPDVSAILLGGVQRFFYRSDLLPSGSATPCRR